MNDSEKEIMRCSTVIDTLHKLHDGEAITDVALDDTMCYLGGVLNIFEDCNIPSMPEYNVFAKALRRDIMTLEGFKRSRDERKIREQQREHRSQNLNQA